MMTDVTKKNSTLTFTFTQDMNTGLLGQSPGLLELPSPILSPLSGLSCSLCYACLSERPDASLTDTKGCIVRPYLIQRATGQAAFLTPWG